MDLYEQDPSGGSRIARGMARVGGLIGATGLLGACGTVLIDESQNLNPDSHQVAYVSQTDNTAELLAKTGATGLGVAIVSLTINSSVHAYQRRRFRKYEQKGS